MTRLEELKEKDRVAQEQWAQWAEIADDAAKKLEAAKLDFDVALKNADHAQAQHSEFSLLIDIEIRNEAIRAGW